MKTGRLGGFPGWTGREVEGGISFLFPAFARRFEIPSSCIFSQSCAALSPCFGLPLAPFAALRFKWIVSTISIAPGLPLLNPPFKPTSPAEGVAASVIHSCLDLDRSDCQSVLVTEPSCYPMVAFCCHQQQRRQAASIVLDMEILRPSSLRVDVLPLWQIQSNTGLLVRARPLVK